MIKPDTDTLQALIRLDKKVYSWLAESLNEHIAMIDELDPDDHANMRKDLMAKACQLKEIMDIVIKSKETLSNMQRQSDIKEELPTTQVF